jgi:hypothetical protein
VAVCRRDFSRFARSACKSMILRLDGKGAALGIERLPLADFGTDARRFSVALHAGDFRAAMLFRFAIYASFPK